MFPKRIENTVGKGEIARNEQFLLFPQCFQNTCMVDMQKQGLVWEMVKAFVAQTVKCIIQLGRDTHTDNLLFQVAPPSSDS